MATKKSLGGNLLNYNQVKNQHKKLNCRNSKSLQAKAEAISSQDDNKNDNENEKKRRRKN